MSLNLYSIGFEIRLGDNLEQKKRYKKKRELTLYIVSPITGRAETDDEHGWISYR